MNQRVEGYMQRQDTINERLTAAIERLEVTQRALKPCWRGSCAGPRTAGKPSYTVFPSGTAFLAAHSPRLLAGCAAHPLHQLATMLPVCRSRIVAMPCLFLSCARSVP
jgi:hypothetical protein